MHECAQRAVLREIAPLKSGTRKPLKHTQQLQSRLEHQPGTPHTHSHHTAKVRKNSSNNLVSVISTHAYSRSMIITQRCGWGSQLNALALRTLQLNIALARGPMDRNQTISIMWLRWSGFHSITRLTQATLILLINRQFFLHKLYEDGWWLCMRLSCIPKEMS